MSVLRSRTPPVLVVLGATGAGKSKLALELAQKFGGEVISADAMQMYKGLDIVTNKVTKEEMSMVRHHMISLVDPLQRCTVVDFKKQALPIIEDMLSKKVMPVICGGTNYYIESLLWKILIDSHSSTNKDEESEQNEFKVDDLAFEEVEATTEELYAKLKEIDPLRANELHPKERRKIMRSLQVFQQTGKMHSDFISSQRTEEGGNAQGGPLRYENSVVFWVQCDANILDQRCDKRVDKMIQLGLVKELEDFHEEYNSKRSEPDYTVGIFQSIGFKEFHNYLLLTPEEKASETGQKLFNESVKLMKLATRQYARRQVRWIKNRFLYKDRNSPPVYAVSSNNPENWDQDCHQPAVEALEALLNGKTPAMLPMEKISRDHDLLALRQVQYCSICDRHFHGQLQWTDHINSKKHGKEIKRLNKRTVVIDGLEKELNDSKELLQIVKKVKEISGKSLTELKTSLSSNVSFDLGLTLDLKEAENVKTVLTGLGVKANLQNIKKDREPKKN